MQFFDATLLLMLMAAFDAIFGGALGTWMFAFVAGNLLGPIGLFRGLGDLDDCDYARAVHFHNLSQ